MRFYYTREPGDEGQLLTEDGDAPGTPLSTILKACGPMPHRAVLELISYLADILTISEEDRAVHGAITPNGIFIDEGGAVSIGGWEPRPRPTRAPEGRAVGPATDVFGLGEVMLSAMTGRPLAEAPPTDRSVYDDHILARLGEVDWAAMGSRKWVTEVQHFLCAMLAHTPEERPQSLDIANVLGGVASVAPGDDVTVWSDLVLGEDLSQRGPWSDSLHSEADGYPDEAPAPDVFEEDLGGPQAIGDNPVSKTAALRLRKAASAKGESTAFWSRDKIAALLEDEDEDDEPVRATFVPRTGSTPGAQAPPVSPFDAPTRRNPMPPPMPPVQAQAQPPVVPPPPQPQAAIDPPQPPQPPQPQPPQAQAPPPPQPQAASQAPPTPQPQPPQPQPPQPQPPQPQPPQPQPQPPQPQPQPQPPQPQPPQPRLPSPVAAGPVVVTPPAGDAPPKKGISTGLIIGVVVGLVVLCGGIPSVGGIIYYLTATTDTPAETIEPVTPPPAAAPTDDAADSGDPEEDARKADEERKAEEARKAEETRKAEEARKAEKARKAREARSSSSSRSGSSSSSSSGRRSSSSSSRRSSGSSSSTPSESSGGDFPATVKFVHQGVTTTLQCGDGQKQEFVGTTRLTFSTVTTCLVLADGKKGAVTLNKSGTSTCSISGDRIRCTGP